MLAQIRWKLALSYMLVSVIAWLVLEAGFLGTIFLIVSSDFLPHQLVLDMQRELVPRVAQCLEEDPPRMDDLRRLIAQFSLPSLGVFVSEQGVTLRPASLGGQGQLLVVDTAYRVLAATQGEIAEGDLLRSTDFPELFPLLQKAMAGERDPDQLYSRQVEGLLLAVAPVYGEDGAVVGSLVVMAVFPTDVAPFLSTLIKVGVRGVILLTGPIALIGTLAGILVSAPLSRRLRRLAQVAGAWKQGDLGVRIGDRANDELGQLAARLDQMVDQLQLLMKEERDLAVLEERNRVALDLHDTLKQRLFAISVLVATLQSLAEQGKWDVLQARIPEVAALVQQAQAEITQIIHNIRPAEGSRDLVAVIEEDIERWSRRWGISARFEMEGILTAEPSQAVRDLLKKILSEALSNVARHSGATHVEVTLGQEDGQIWLVVADNGKGFDPAQAMRKGLGLISMQERVRRAGGTFAIQSAPRKGTRLRAQIPVA